jgi:uncharacterized protein (TIGR03435 family)
LRVEIYIGILPAWRPIDDCECASAGGGTEAPEPGGSLFAAIKSMGLKLELRKVPMLVVVVDHCEKMPTDN